MPYTHLSKKGIQYNVIYLCVCLLPFLYFLDKEGMTAIIAKTLGFITLPISLIIWLLDLESFHKFFITHVGINVILNILILLWLGSLIKRRENETN